MAELIQEPESSMAQHLPGSSDPAIAITTTTTDGAITPHHSQCCTCTCTCGNSINTMKRPSPSSPYSPSDPSSNTTTTTSNDSEPKPKKLFVEQDVSNRNGFSTFSIPNRFTKTQTYPILRRCFSDPNNPPAAQLFPGTGSPENMKTVSNATTPSPTKGSNSASRLPPLPPALNRSASDLSPSPVKSYSRTSSFGDIDVEGTPNSKKFRRILDGMKEIVRMWDEVCAECGPEQNANATKDDYETDDAEFVSVEKSGEGLIIHFNCQCSKVYQILLSGSNCYYKLNAE